MTPEESTKFWDSVNVDFRIVERIYVAIVMGADKQSFGLTDDEARVWDVLAEDIKKNPAPAGSTYEIPSFN